MIFADQAAEDLLALDSGGDIDGAAGLPRRSLLQALMRPMPVIVAGELGHHLAEMPFAEDQHMIQAFSAKRAHEPLGKCIRTRRPDRRLDDSRSIPSGNWSGPFERGVTLPVLSWNGKDAGSPVGDLGPVVASGCAW